MKKLRNLIKHDCPQICIGRSYGDGNPTEYFVMWYAYNWYRTKLKSTQKEAIDEAERILKLSEKEQEEYITNFNSYAI